VSLSTTITTWERIDKFYLSAVPVGVITLHEDSGTGTELARIGINQTVQRYYTFYFDPTPSAAITYDLDLEYAITDLAQNTDEPWLPTDFHDLLFYGGLMDELVKTDDTRFAWAERRWNQRLGDLNLHLARQAMETTPSGRTSRLGAWVDGGAF
jgi:hypothetical protein